MLSNDAAQNNTQETLNYDYLILATGSSYPAPMKPVNENHNDIMMELSEIAVQLEQAQRILGSYRWRCRGN